MWFHLERKGTGYASARSGVAVADRVTGPYAYRGSFRPNAGAWPRGIRSDQKVRIEAAAKHKYSGGDLPDEPDRLNLLGPRCFRPAGPIARSSLGHREG